MKGWSDNNIIGNANTVIENPQSNMGVYYPAGVKS